MEFKLKAEKRAKNEKLAADIIPAVLYGKGVENQSLKLKKVDFEKAFNGAGESNLIDLDLGTGIVKVLVKDLQRDILKYTFTHVDFYQVNMKEKITTEIPLHFIGEAKAIKELGGMLMKEINELEVECLPNDLVDHIDIDISVLANFHDEITTEDIVLPKGMKLEDETKRIICSVIPPRIIVEEVVEAAPVVTAVKDEAKDEKKDEKKDNK